MDIDLIRSAYPSPMRGQGQMAYPAGAYCVGGALCAFYALVTELALPDLFPDRVTLADALQIINPLLTAPRAAFLAQQIILHNDDGAFDRAWLVAHAAVNDGIYRARRP